MNIRSGFFSRAIGHRVTKILAYNECALSRHRPRAASYLKLRIYLPTDEVFKSLIANMAGFLLWLSETNIMIEVFKVASAQWLLFYQWI